MSATNFYQTFYQTDQLYRLANESWSSQTVDSTIVLEEQADLADTSNLLADLDALSFKEVGVEETILVDTILPETPVSINTEQESKQPEVLPASTPRPTVPSITPPIQQKPKLPPLNHKVLLLADEELDPSNLLFLEKILKAVNLNIAGVDLLNIHGVHEMDFPELLRGKYINHFITFGVPFERINLDIMMDRYAPVRFEGITFLMADSLPTIEADQQLKKRLWGALQRIFLR
ncbi:hypothetical protein GCM10028805_16590 [Spirosoma harenae]